MAKSFFDDPNIEAWKALSPKDAAHRLIEFMQEVARDALADKALKPEDKTTLAVAEEGLLPAFELVSASRRAPNDKAFYSALSWIMGHSFVIGQRVGFLDKRAQKVFQCVQTEVMRGAKGNQALYDAIVAEVRTRGKIAVSIEYARLIRPNVICRLALKPGQKEPSAGQIKTRLADIKRSALKNRPENRSALKEPPYRLLAAI